MKIDVYEKVTAQIVAALENGTVPWHKPWDPTIGQPMSLSTGKAYKGINVLLLGMQAQSAGYESPYWGTYKQIGERGGQVRKGEKGTAITFWKKLTSSKQNEATGQLEPKTYMMLKYFTVFNAEQADAVEAGTVQKDGNVATGVFKLPQPTERAPFSPIDAAETIFNGYFSRVGSPSLNVAQDGRAWYSPSRDAVSLPPRESFHSPEAFYSTAFHEATHSTGHTSRLAREGVLEGHPFGSDMYAAEELVAEMGAAMLCGHSGIENTVDASASYLASWLRVLKGNVKLVLQAASKAQKATDVVLGVVADASGSEQVAA